MPIQKPAPLMVDGKPHYSLSSYDPVSITVVVPLATDEDVSFALATMVRQAGGTPESLQDAAWLKDNFGTDSVDELAAAVQNEVVRANQEMAEEQKAMLCGQELAKRLNQSVPAAYVQEAQEHVAMTFFQQMAAQGISPQDFQAASGVTPDRLDDLFAVQAREMAEEEAALDAFASHRKIVAEEGEWADLLGLPAAEFESLLSQAKASHQVDALRLAATRAKAMGVLVEECDCTYHHETEEEAKARVARYGAGPDFPGATGMPAGPAPQGSGDDRPHLTLV